MKKRISVITLLPRSCGFYAGQVEKLFGGWAEVYAYSTGDESVNQIRQSDLYLISTDAFEAADKVRQYVPADGQMVEIQVTYPKSVVERLKKLPKGKRVLFVNATHQMAREAVTQLEQLGVSQPVFRPYGPDINDLPGAELEKIDLAVTPDEEAFVPPGIKTINIGHRPCAPSTVIEIAIRLGLEGLLEGKEFQDYMKSMAAGNYSFEQMFLRSRRLESRLDLLLEILDQGMIGVNESGEIFACNKKAGDITGMDSRIILGRPGHEVFPYIPFRQCIREQTGIAPRLIKIGSATVNLAVVPVVRRGECIGAFASLQRFNELEKRQNELRSQLMHKGYRAKYQFEDVIGASAAIDKTKSILRRMALTESPVLLIGETGTGKELFAHALHQASGRSEGPFVAINVAAMPENLLESELFGYEEGAFTGAKKGGRPGLFEFAHKGTLFLDEVEGMSPAMQVKLLRVLQEQEVMRVGGNQIISVDVRIVAATNEFLEEKVAAGSFRKDLYYRLNALPVLIPPLRERADDILLLLEHFRRKTGSEFTLSEKVRRLLLCYPWPGNIRELQNVVEYLSFTGQAQVCVEDLPPAFARFQERFASAGEASVSGGVLPQRDDKPDDKLGDKPEKNGKSVMAPDSARLAGAEFWFLLEQLYSASQDNRLIGRETLLAAAKARHFPLSQKEVRGLLAEMADEGLVKVSKGRGGSRLTPKGRSVWESRSGLDALTN